MTIDLLAVSVGIALVLTLTRLFLLLRNRRWMAWPPESRCTASRNVSVSVIVPARNEAEDIEKCVRSLLAQTQQNLKIFVVNDHSTDDTPQILDCIATQNPQLNVIHDPILRPGWLGKQNAMQAAFERVDSELVLLTDADVIYEPDCVSCAVGELQVRHLDLLSLLPQFHFVTFCETMLLPIYADGCAALLSPSIEDPQSDHAIAAGAFILLRTERLKQTGGFAPIRNEILDDVSMARTIKRQGGAISLRSAPDLMKVRLFKNNRHAFFGSTKHLLGLVQHRLWLAPILAVVPLCMYGILFWGLIAGLMQQHWLLAGAALAALVVHYVALLLTRPDNHFHAGVALAFPLSSVQFAAACLHAAYLLIARGRFIWRGRTSDLKSES